jgi:glutamate carboxypeptidase
MPVCSLPVRPIPEGRRSARPALGRIFALLAATMPAAASAQGLTAEERRIANFVDGLREDPIEFLERVVNIESATQNLAGVRRVGVVFREEFDRLGFETRWEEMPPEMRRAGHLVA